MQITLLSIGKTRNAHFAALEDEYAKRISGRFSFDRHYVKNEKELLAAAEKAKGRLILCDEHGSVMTSQEFGTYMGNAAQQGQPLTFVIGDAEGLPQQLRDLPADIIALSEMTFPHELARVVLIEQLYRAQTILDRHPYHK